MYYGLLGLDTKELSLEVKRLNSFHLLLQTRKPLRLSGQCEIYGLLPVWAFLFCCLHMTCFLDRN